MRRAAIGLLLVYSFLLVVALACHKDTGNNASPCDEAALNKARSLEELGDFYLSSQEYGEALPLYRDALAVRTNCPEQAPLVLADTSRKLAIVYVQLERYDEALPHYQSALEILQGNPGADQSILANTHDGLGNVYAHMNSYQDALSQFQEALEIRRNDAKATPLAIAASYDNVGRMLVLQSNYEGAIPSFESALEIREASPDVNRRDLAISYDNLATGYAHAGLYDQALSHYRKSLSIRQQDPDANPLDIAAAHDNIGDTLSRLESYDEAITNYQESLSIRQGDPRADALNLATTHDHLGGALAHLESYDDALTHYREALSLRQGDPRAEPLDIATNHDHLGQIYVKMNNREEALQHYQESVALRRDNVGSAPIERATAYNNLALLYRYLGQYGQAEPLLKEAVKIIEEVRGPNHPDTAIALNNLADLYIATGNFAEAVPIAERALEIRTVNPDANPEDLAESINNTAVAYFHLGKRELALELLRQSLELKETELGPDNPAIAPFINNLAVIYRSVGEDDLALQQYLRALALRQKELGPDHPDTAMSMNNLAALYSSQGNYAEALPLFQQTLDIWEKTLGPDHPNTARVLANLALLHESRGEYQEALELYRRSLSAEDRAFESVFTIASEEQKLRFTQVNEGTFHATLSLIQRHLRNDPSAVRFALELVLKRKGIVLDAQFQAQSALTKNLEGPALESWLELRRLRGELANALLRGPAEKSLVSFQQSIQDLEDAIADKEDILSQYSNQFSGNVSSQGAAAQMVAERLPADTVLIEYFRVQDWDETSKGWAKSSRYLAFTLTAGNSVSLFDLGNADSIDSEVRDTLEAINAPIDSGNAGAVGDYHRKSSQRLTQLYGMLLGPMDATIVAHQRLIVSPDSEINKVPFAALRIPSGEYLVETHTISYVASGRDLLREEVPVPAGADLVLVADPAYEDQNVFPVVPLQETSNRAPDFNEKFLPLPGTAREAEVISPIFTGQQSVLLGKDANESAIKSLKSPRVLHLATHGFFLQDRFRDDRPSELPTLLSRSSLVVGDTERGVGGVKDLSLPPSGELKKESYLDPMVRSGMALAGANHAGLVTSGDDGILTALEVTNMDLRGTDLVVLSACQTALGEVSNGEGVFGLRRAFELAGAENLVMSLWPVSDNATVTQMEQFYEAFESGSTAPESLRQAQLDAIRTLKGETLKRLGEPVAPVKIWAPFIAQQNVGSP